ncbi:MAG: hypothetical protein OXI27_05305 [Thaumarchaeota archaeon]|nr:hypothetical protein [Nitrososphaerota archaeon]
MRAYKAERRRQKIKECRDYKTYERKRKGEGRVKRIRIKQLAKLIRDTLLNATDANVARIVCVVDTTCAKVHLLQSRRLIPHPPAGGQCTPQRTL